MMMMMMMMVEEELLLARPPTFFFFHLSSFDIHFLKISRRKFVVRVSHLLFFFSKGGLLLLLLPCVVLTFSNVINTESFFLKG
jgi:hypothetical protein